MMSEICATSRSAAIRGAASLPKLLAGRRMCVYAPASPTASAAIPPAVGVANSGASACSTLATPAMFEATRATALASCPATRTWISPPIFCAAATTCWVTGLRAPLSCSAMTRMVMSTAFPRKRETPVSLKKPTGSPAEPAPECLDDFAASPKLASRDHLGFVAELRHELLRVRDLAPALALRRLDHLERDQSRRDVDAERVGLRDVERLLLRLHDVRQRRITRLVEPQVGRDDRRQRHCESFQPAVDLALDRRLHAAVRRREIDLRGEGRLRPAEERREHLPRLVGVVVDRLLAHEHELGRFLLDDRLEKLGHGERLELGIGLDQNRAVGAQRQRRPKRLLARGDPARHGDQLGRDALLLEANGLLDRDLVERIHRHLDVRGIDAGPVRPDPYLDVEIDDAFDRNENFHGDFPRLQAPRAH